MPVVSQNTHTTIVVTTNPLALDAVEEDLSRRTTTLNSTVSSYGDDDGIDTLRNRRTGRSFFRGVYNRLRVAALLSRARRTEPGHEAEADVSAVLGDMPLEEVRLKRHESVNARSYTRQESNKSNKKSSQRQLSSNSHLPLSHVESMMAGNTGTTRDYVLGKGHIHFWRNYSFETEVSQM